MATGIPAPHHARLPLNGAMTPMNIVLFGTLAEVIKFVVDNSRKPKEKDSFILSACSCYYCCRSCCFLMKNLFLRLMHAVLFVPLSRSLPDFLLSHFPCRSPVNNVVCHGFQGLQWWQTSQGISLDGNNIKTGTTIVTYYFMSAWIRLWPWLYSLFPAKKDEKHEIKIARKSRNKGNVRKSLSLTELTTVVIIHQNAKSFK